MEQVLKTPETKEKTYLERELNELLEATFRMEHELKLLLQETGAE